MAFPTPRSASRCRRAKPARTAGYADLLCHGGRRGLDPFWVRNLSPRGCGYPALNGRRASTPATRAAARGGVGSTGRPGSIPGMVRDVRRLSERVRKLRIMGSAALALAYVAAGRFDAYVERGIRLWDIAAGGLLIESAGGTFERKEVGSEGRTLLTASNGRAGRAPRRWL
ncbi:MAG: hypothetical protein KIT22_00830 [Verrucomicrobiae bacterium]|nr:hypothetical protein [Verrucomicrobiae bacterium]